MSDLLVKVWNRNEFDYSEKFKGVDIFIKAKGYVKMDYEEANRFMGTMPNFKRLKDGTQDPRSYKALEMDKDDRKRAESSLRNEQEEKLKRVFVCHACAKEFDTKKALLKHSDAEHSDIMVEDKDE